MVRDRFWGQKTSLLSSLRLKGAEIMVSDSITEQDGYLALSEELTTRVLRTSRVFLEYDSDKEGYRIGKKFIAYVWDAAAIANFKYPSKQCTICGYLFRAAAIVPMEKMLGMPGR